MRRRLTKGNKSIGRRLQIGIMRQLPDPPDAAFASDGAK
jgi:hypothetical protein